MESRSVNVPKSATLQNDPLEMSQSQLAEFVGRQLRERITTQVQHLNIKNNTRPADIV